MQAGLVMGRIAEREELVIESLMTVGGVIFFDGVELVFLEFNADVIAWLTVVEKPATLVVK